MKAFHHARADRFDVVDHVLSFLEAEGFVSCLPRFVVQQSVPQGASR